MSIFDKLRRSGSKAKEQADHVVEQHGDKIATGIEKTGEVASKVTGHRFDDKIDKGVSKAKERLEQHEGGTETPPGPASTTGSAPEAAPESTPEPPPASSTGDEPTTDPRPGPGSGPTA